MQITFLFIELFAPVALATVALLFMSARKSRQLNVEDTIYERRVSRPVRSVVSTI